MTLYVVCLVVVLDLMAVASLAYAWWLCWRERRQSRRALPRRHRPFSSGLPCAAPPVRGVNRPGSPGGRESRLRGRLTTVTTTNEKEQ